MRRLVCLGVMISTGMMGACGSDSSPCGSGGAGGAAGHPTAGTAGGAAGQAAGGAAGQAAGGAAGQAAGGAAGQAGGGAAGQAAGGAAGQAKEGAAGQAGGSAAGQAAGGAAGSGVAGAGGLAGGGAAGQGGVTCLDPSAFSAWFSIADSTFCAVALYTAPEALGAAMPTWGGHGGPLVVQGTTTDTGVTLERWSPPAGSTGAMTVATTPVASAKPASTYLGSQAVDLPFFGWTAISWENAFPNTAGQLEMIANGVVGTTYDVSGPFALAAVPAASSLGRLFYAGLSPLGTTTVAGNGLYEADACSSPAPALGSGQGCSASAVVASWGDSSGPIVTDANGDVIAVMNSIASSNQEARGFVASSVARGAGATTGVTLFTLAGFSGSLAALTPTANGAGLVVFQPFDGTTFDPLDVIQQKFTTSSGALAAVGTPTKLLAMPSGQPQSLSFLVDGTERLWVAASGASSTTYVVLARR